VNSAHGEHKFKARTGHHLAPLTLSSGKNIFEEIGNNFCLIALDGDVTDIRDIQSIANQKKIPLNVVRDNLDGGRDKYDTRYILVRPDHYIVWNSNTVPLNINKILSKVVGI
jgi:hypothetical protein